MARPNNIIFSNIRIEMARKNLTINEMSKLSEINYQKNYLEKERLI